MLSDLGMTIRAVAFMALAFGPALLLLRRFERDPRPLAGKQKAGRWLAALGLAVVSWLVAAAAFPGPWSG